MASGARPLTSMPGSVQAVFEGVFNSSGECSSENQPLMMEKLFGEASG
jgi:hypothetical protein